jgi:hypothetical protein
VKRTGKTNAELIAEGKVPPHYGVGKSDGDDAVQAWIGLLPGWQSARAAEIDAIVTAAVVPLAKGIRYNGAWYGRPGGGWFLALNARKRHLKLTFFDGLSLTPVPPVTFKVLASRGLDLRADDPVDADRIGDWVRQASRLPGYGKT